MKQLPRILINDVDLLISELPYRKQYKQSLSNGCKYVLSLIQDKRITDKAYKNSDFVNLKEEYLRNILSVRHTTPVLDLLKDNDIIQCDYKRIFGKKSYAYRINKKYLESDFVSFKMPDIFKKRIKKYTDSIDVFDKKKDIIENIVNKTKHLPLYYDTLSADYLKLINFLKKIDINGTDAYQFVNGLFNKGKITDEQKYYYDLCIKKITDKDFFFEIDSKTGRVFTNITNLFKELRQFLRYDNKKLVEIDITCSQPLFLSIILKDFTKLYHSKGVVFDDITLFIKHTQKDIYKYIQKLYNHRLSEDKTRQVIKEMFIRFLFQSTQANYHTDFGKFFRKIMPNVFNIIINIKKHSELKKKHSSLALLLQRSEAEIIMNTALDFAKNGAPVWTVHDSIITTSEYTDKVIEILMGTFELYDIKPNLKVTVLNEKQVDQNQLTSELIAEYEKLFADLDAKLKRQKDPTLGLAYGS